MQLKSLFWLNGALFTLLGMAMFFMPELTLRMMLILLAIENLLSALYIFYVFRHYQGESKAWIYMMGVLQMVFGASLLVFPEFGNFLLLMIVVVFAVGVMGIGGIFAVDALRVRRLGISSWWMLLLLGIASVVLGVFVLSNAFLTLLSLTILLGLSFIAFGIGLIVKGYKLPSLKKQVIILNEDE